MASDTLRILVAPVKHLVTEEQRKAALEWFEMWLLTQLEMASRVRERPEEVPVFAPSSGRSRSRLAQLFSPFTLIQSTCHFSTYCIPRRHRLGWCANRHRAGAHSRR
jgi:hypothetical protein